MHNQLEYILRVYGETSAERLEGTQIKWLFRIIFGVFFLCLSLGFYRIWVFESEADNGLQTNMSEN